MITITIDSNCINAKSNLEHMNIIEKAESEGKIQILKTDTMDTEFQKNNGYPIGLEKSKKYDEDIGIWILGHSRLGHTKFATDETKSSFDLLKTVLFPDKKLTQNDIRDCMHINTHIMYKRDYFITKEKRLLGKSGVINKIFSTEILSPEEFCGKILNY